MTTFYVESTELIAQYTVNLGFSADVLQVDDTNNNDALNAANYTVTAITTGALELAVGNIETMDAHTVTLYLYPTDINENMRAELQASERLEIPQYRITVENIAGSGGETLVNPKYADFFSELSPLVMKEDDLLYGYDLYYDLDFGIYQTKNNGDLLQHTGYAYLKKRTWLSS